MPAFLTEHEKLNIHQSIKNDEYLKSLSLTKMSYRNLDALKMGLQGKSIDYLKANVASSIVVVSYQNAYSKEISKKDSSDVIVRYSWCMRYVPITIESLRDIMKQERNLHMYEVMIKPYNALTRLFFDIDCSNYIEHYNLKSMLSDLETGLETVYGFSADLLKKERRVSVAIDEQGNEKKFGVHVTYDTLVPWDTQNSKIDEVYKAVAACGKGVGKMLTAECEKEDPKQLLLVTLLDQEELDYAESDIEEVLESYDIELTSKSVKKQEGGRVTILYTIDELEDKVDISDVECFIREKVGEVEVRLYDCKPALDKSVYSSDHLMRLPYQTKLGSCRTQVPLDSNLHGKMDHSMDDLFTVVCYNDKATDALYSYHKAKTFAADVSENVNSLQSSKRKRKRKELTAGGRVEDVVKPVKKPKGKKELQKIDPSLTDKVLDFSSMSLADKLNAIPNKGEFVQHRDKWFPLACSFFLNGGTYEDFAKWDNVGDCAKLKETWDTIAKRQSTTGIAKFEDHINISLRKQYPKSFVKEFDTLVDKDYMAKINITKIHSKYIGPEVVDGKMDTEQVNSNVFYQMLNDPKIKCIVVESQMCTGKTEALYNWLNLRENKHKSVQVVSCRRTLAAKYKNDLCPRVRDSVALYSKDKGGRDEKGNYKLNWVTAKNRIVQAESLRALIDADRHELERDILILDEIESIIPQLVNDKTNRGGAYGKAFRVLRNLMMISKKVIIMDHFIKRLGQNFIKSCYIDFSEIAHIKNTYVPVKLSIDLHSSADKLAQKFFTEYANLQEGEQLVFFFTSVARLSAIHETLKRMYPDDEELIKVYHGLHSPDPRGFDANIEWAKYKVIMYTSTITVGISYTLPNVKYVFCEASNTPLRCTDVLQAIRRVRYIKTGKIQMYIRSCKPTAYPTYDTVLNMFRMNHLEWLQTFKNTSSSYSKGMFLKRLNEQMNIKAGNTNEALKRWQDAIDNNYVPSIVQCQVNHRLDYMTSCVAFKDYFKQLTKEMEIEYNEVKEEEAKEEEAKEEESKVELEEAKRPMYFDIIEPIDQRQIDNLKADDLRLSNEGKDRAMIKYQLMKSKLKLKYDVSTLEALPNLMEVVWSHMAEDLLTTHRNHMLELMTAEEFVIYFSQKSRIDSDLIKVRSTLRKWAMIQKLKEICELETTHCGYIPNEKIEQMLNMEPISLDNGIEQMAIASADDSAADVEERRPSTKRRKKNKEQEKTYANFIEQLYDTFCPRGTSGSSDKADKDPVGTATNKIIKALKKWKPALTSAADMKRRTRINNKRVYSGIDLVIGISSKIKGTGLSKSEIALLNSYVKQDDFMMLPSQEDRTLALQSVQRGIVPTPTGKELEDVDNIIRCSGSKFEFLYN